MRAALVRALVVMVINDQTVIAVAYGAMLVR